MITMFLCEFIMEVVDLPPVAVNLFIPDITKIACSVEFCGEGLADIPTDVIHSGGPRVVQPRFEPIQASTKLAHMGTNKQVFQISGTLVAFVLMAQHDEVGLGNEFPCGVCFILAK